MLLGRHAIKHIAVTGAIGAGKSTLAARLARERGAVLLSSDAIRDALSGKASRKGSRVFAAMRERLSLALLRGKPVVLDSTGMSSRFRAILHAHRALFVHVHLTLKDEQLFEQRERGRTDRPSGPLSRAAFKHSQRVVFRDAPDVIVATDELDPECVYSAVLAALDQSRLMGGGAA